MSVPQLISPLLDGFVMGDAISGHDGVRACPAMQLETDKKYIVKIISLPASPAKLDALLLAGAFTDQESALAYFKELADDVLAEAELLQKLSRHEGFVCFEDWQMIPMSDDETGYDIYLLSPYRPTLDNVLRNNEMTHLQAINMGLDLCAALSASRRLGYLYANLRPSNIYLCNEREFCIGDLGFLSLDSLQYASLPDKYHSDYTPPEISDAYSALNGTMDTYAVGLLLYQAYNDGLLPPIGVTPIAPRHADAALSEIILKACSADPEQRWQDPVQLGQALANYMQSNTVNDIPIVPPVEEEITEPEEVFPDEDPEPSTHEILAEVDQALETAPPIIPAPTEEETESATIAEEISNEPEASEDVAVIEDVAEAETFAVEEETVEADEGAAEVSETENVEEISDEDVTTQDEPEVEESAHDETAEILAQADDLIAHQLPDPPVAPEPFEVTLPEEPETVAEEESESEEVTSDDETEPETENDDVSEEETEEEVQDEVAIEEQDPDEETQPKKRRKGLLTLAIILSAVLLLGAAAVLFYEFFYLQTIDKMELLGFEDQLTVSLTTDIADEKLSVKCTDTHGNALTAEVKDGKAYFTGLKSGTTYKLEVRIDGFHKLLGEIKQDYTTAVQTVINGFYAATGPENGSVILSFTPQGPASAQWNVTYSAEGEETKTATFAGHMVTLTGLTVGKEYTFKLEPVTDLYLSGTDTVTYTISNVVYAEDLDILGFVDGNLVITWKTPAGITVPQWYIRCYNDTGFDKTLSTAENTISFEGLDITSGYTVEVTAEGMTLGNRTYLSPNSIFITNLQVNGSDRTDLKVTWESESGIPEGGWLLMYTIDGSTEQQVIACNGNSAIITPLIPGARYVITIQPANGTTAFGGKTEYDAAAATSFSGYSVKASNMEFSMCKTPSKANWDRDDVSSKNYTTTFKVGVSASFVMHLDKKTSKSLDEVTTLYVIRDADGKLVSAKTESRTWDDMWDNRYGELTIPVMPETVGTYTVEIYFNGMTATTQSFEVIEKE